MSSLPIKLRDSAVWKQAVGVAEFIYNEVLKQLADFPDEKWNTERKLRSATNDMIFYLAQAIGSSSPGATEFDWNIARKNLFALQSMYIFAGKQQFLKINPDIIVQIDGLIIECDRGIERSQNEIALKNKAELEPWLEKYRLWQAMQDDSYRH